MATAWKDERTCEAVTFDSELLPVAAGAVDLRFVRARVGAVERLVTRHCKTKLRHEQYCVHIGLKSFTQF